MSEKPHPLEIRLHQNSRRLEIKFDNGAQFSLSCEYLRVHSPSAEVRGHGAGRPALVAGKRDVNIEKIEAVGQYAVRLHFDDGHNSGIYSWETLYDLAAGFERNWREYRARLAEAGEQR